jgi:hypothetical protein
MPQSKPVEGQELIASRQLIREVIFSLYRQKRDLLASMQMPAQPVSLSEIYLEICSRVQILRHCGRWSFPFHEKRWWDRRVNESACPTYYDDGVPKVVAATAGLYMPSPNLFAKKPLEVQT